MNICILNHRENNPYIGGVERISYTLAHLWRERGYSIVFLSLQRSNIKKSYESECAEYFLPNFDILSVENEKYVVEIFRKHEISIVINQASVFPKVCQLAQLIKKRFPLVKLITTIHYAPLFQLAGIENNFFLPGVYSLKQRIYSFLLMVRYYAYFRECLIMREKKALQDIASYSDSIVCLSETFIPSFKKLLGSSNYNKIIAIPNAVKSIEYDVHLKKKKQVLYVGRLEYGLKRVDRILAIWKEIEQDFNDWHLCIVGDGNAAESLKQLAKSYHLRNVSFEGFKNPENYFAESAIFCLTSSSEGFGLVLTEALAAKCVPIAYRSFLSVVDIIENGKNGILVEPYKKKDYVAKLRKLMEDSSVRDQLAQNNRLTLDKFEPHNVLEKWDKLFLTI